MRRRVKSRPFAGSARLSETLRAAAGELQHVGVHAELDVLGSFWISASITVASTGTTALHELHSR